MRARALFAKFPDEPQPILVAAMDETIWEHIDDDPFEETKTEWPPEYEWVEAWVEFGDDLGLVLFRPTPHVLGVAEPVTDTRRGAALSPDLNRDHGDEDDA